MTVKLKITTKWTLKMSKVSSFYPHSMCERVESVTAKTGRTSCTNWTISFGVSGFQTRTHLLHWHFIFLTYYNSRLVCVSYAPFKATSSIFNTFWHHLLFFSHLPILKLITTPDFFAFHTHHSNRRHQFSKLSDIICYFLVIYRFV